VADDQAFEFDAPTWRGWIFLTRAMGGKMVFGLHMADEVRRHGLWDDDVMILRQPILVAGVVVEDAED
jgi:hypothetical protein